MRLSKIADSVFSRTLPVTWRRSRDVMAENIYQMYVANGNKAGFRVQRNSWSW